jgi:dTDP-4-dehydrorhamnose reductase
MVSKPLGMVAFTQNKKSGIQRVLSKMVHTKPRNDSARILITGSKGMLGHDLVIAFQGFGSITGIDIENCDIRNYDQTASLIRKIAPHIVLHAAAYTRVDDCESNVKEAFEVNTYGASNVAKACREIEAFMVYYSTDYLFDGATQIPYTEESCPNPLSIYGKSKLEGEFEVLRILPENHLILRTAWLFGLYGRNFIDTILCKTKIQKVLTIVNDQTGCPTFSGDLAGATRQLIEKHASGIFNVTNKGFCSWYQFAQYFLTNEYPRIEINPISTEELSYPAKRPPYSVLDSAKIEAFLGITLPSWQNAVDRYIVQRSKSK